MRGVTAEPRRPYDPAEYEEQLSQAGGSFPVGPSGGAKLPSTSGLIPTHADGPLPREEESDEQRLQNETAWHHLADPNKPLSHKHREICRLLAKGWNYARISETLGGYTTSYLSLLSCNEKIRKHVSELQDKTFEMTVNDRMNSLNHKALDRVEEMISSEDRDIKLKDRVEAARWLLEKTTGKAKQEIETKDGNLTDFMSLLKQMKEQGASPKHAEQRTLSSPGEEASFIDVTPASDPLSDWVKNEI